MMADGDFVGPWPEAAELWRRVGEAVGTERRDGLWHHPDLLPVGGQALGVAVVNGLTRAFLGDTAASQLGVPDTVLKHLPSVIGPVVGGVNRVLGAVPGVSEWRTRRALAGYPMVMEQQRRRYGMSHDLVDAAPGAGGHPAAE